MSYIIYYKYIDIIHRRNNLFCFSIQPFFFQLSSKCSHCPSSIKNNEKLVVLLNIKSTYQMLTIKFFCKIHLFSFSPSPFFLVYFFQRK